MSLPAFLLRQKRLRTGDHHSRKAWSLFYQFPEELTVDGNRVTLRKIHFTFDIHDGFFLLRNYALLRELIQFNQGSLSKEGSAYFMHLNPIKVRVQSSEEIYILHEIFTAGCYNINLPSQRCIAIDIGMNAGFTSLYFANRPEIEHVYAFEPFSMTLNEAKANLALNPSVAGKITPFPFGLSDTDKQMEVTYNFDDKGRMGVLGAGRIGISENITKESITLKRASTAVADLCNRHPDLPVILKIDCEGSEYEIINDLSKSGFPALIRVIAIEWHEKGPEPLKEALIMAGFVVVVETPMNQQVGMMYAFRA